MSATIVLADTNVISEFVKSTPDAQVMRWLESVQLLAISAVTLEEAHFGLAWQPNTRKLALFNALVERMHSVYPITPAIAQRGGADFFQNAACAWPRRTAATTAKTHDIRIAQSTIVASLFYIWSQFPYFITVLRDRRGRNF